MNTNSAVLAPDSPILLIPYMWIGDFVRCHSVTKICKERWPDRPVDVLTSSLCAPLADYTPGAGAPFGSVSAPQRSIMRGSFFSP